MNPESIQDSAHPAATPGEQLLGACDVRFARRSGPGGQHRNKVETAAILTHKPTGLAAEANERRSQVENRAEALFRLRLKLALEIRTPIDLAHFQPSARWRSRLKGGAIRVNPAHEDFPALLAEALDVLEDRGYDTKTSADLLNCSSSQLLKFLKREPRAVKLLNDRRVERGLRPLH